jgi:hypothetical protein
MRADVCRPPYRQMFYKIGYNIPKMKLFCDKRKCVKFKNQAPCLARGPWQGRVGLPIEPFQDRLKWSVNLKTNFCAS